MKATATPDAAMPDAATNEKLENIPPSTLYAAASSSARDPVLNIRHRPGCITGAHISSQHLLNSAKPAGVASHRDITEVLMVENYGLKGS
ncbi:hypothetical protein HO173_013009 [Letharia columbiana]|uniref:Uncharacterized protein n=1 Tax=Letharia columbiana TaxID=112416 RepID=A0A8H6FE63_9LECA|nr:uncharacterized protein HO173_013009 [Letharia columbiana]KAF6224569.1 hypothetical protein HO173_013009 [Letharia columbiana]